ncbi:MAG: chemotaxis protein CheV [Oscillospiraceae bacterium]|jgi:two-component system chemotaxis response regulator CheV|nr:chemotaxis protein CheV [Oscillospiraceae bacterium]
MNTNILLESGTNELELLEFQVGDNNFGINISKVVEIMINEDVTPVPNSPEEIEGVFIPRDKLISVIDLHKVVHVPHTSSGKEIFIICEFNRMHVAFHVTSVKGIQRISWADIADPPAVTSGSSDEAIGLATGVAKINDRIIIIMDFEKIVSTLNRDAGLDINGLEKIDRPTVMTGNKHIVVADDSKFLNKMITDSLSKVGFHNIMSFSNGQDAWEYVQSFKDKDDDITSHIACIISDIEMPKMDGHRLTKLIKDDKTLSQIPVLLFSSLINEQMIAKGKSVGADGQFSKPQIKELISYLIKVLS